jgi:hypothetical protein
MRNTSAFQPKSATGLNAGLVAYYRLSDTSDSVGSKTLTQTGTVTYPAGKIGNGASATWNLSNMLSNSALLASNIGTGDVTMSCWIKKASPSTQDYTPTILSLGNNSTGTNSRLYLITAKTTGYAGFYTFDGASTNVDSTVNVSDNAWHHVVGVRSGTTLTIYVDGSGTSNTGTARNVAYNNFRIGNVGEASNFDVLGDAQVDEVGIWNRALSASEVTELYNSTNGIQLPSQALTTKAYYPLNGNSRDYSGNNLTGTDTAITYPQGRFGQAAKFNGSSSRIALPTSTAGTFGGSTITISLWVNYLGVTPADFTWLISKCNDGVDFGSWAVWYRTSGTKLVFMTNSDKTNATQALTEKAITIDNKWHNYLFVNNGTNGLIYIDGLLAASGSREDMDSTAQTMTIGASNSGRYSNCLIDEVIIESRAWTAKEVETYYRKSMLNYKQSVWAKFLQAFTISESVSLTESTSNLRARNFSVSETTTLTESITSALGKIVTIVESISLTETLTTTRTFLVNIAESVGLTEVLAQVKKKWSEKTRSSSTWTEKGRSSSTWTEKDRS